MTDGDDRPAGTTAAWRARLVRLARHRVGGRRLAVWAAVGVVVMLVSTAWGVSTASAQASLGPHEARYEVTLDGEITVDLGPLGTLVIESPAPARLGARVVVQEIPRGVDAFADVDTLEALTRDLERYGQFFSAPEATIAVAVRALVADAVTRALLMTAGLTAGLLVVRGLMGPARRRELGRRAARHRPAIAGAVVLVLLVPPTLTASSEAALDRGTATASTRVFDGTPLEGARITGRLAGIIDTYGGYVVDAYEQNEAFYTGIQTDVEEAWQTRTAVDARLDLIGELLGRPAQPRGDDLVTLLLVSDLHCNVGMGRVIRTLTDVSEADVVLNAGDTTANGTAVESYCVEELVGATTDRVPTVVADGNHDSPQTSDQERAVGAIVLDGDVVSVEGIRILGDTDPRSTRIGIGTTLAGDETPAEMAERLVEVACRGDVDLMLVHDPAIGLGALEEGCVPAVLSGHMHTREGPVQHGQGVRYTSGSSAGAVLGKPTVGPLGGTAELTVLRFDPETRTLVDLRLVQAEPDGSVAVGPWLPWPRPIPPDAPAGEPDDEDDAPDGTEAPTDGPTGPTDAPTGPTGPTDDPTGPTGGGSEGGAGT